MVFPAKIKKYCCGIKSLMEYSGFRTEHPELFFKK